MSTWSEPRDLFVSVIPYGSTRWRGVIKRVGSGAEIWRCGHLAGHITTDVARHCARRQLAARQP